MDDVQTVAWALRFRDPATTEPITEFYESKASAMVAADNGFDRMLGDVEMFAVIEARHYGLLAKRVRELEGAVRAIREQADPKAGDEDACLYEIRRLADSAMQQDASARGGGVRNSFR